LSKPEPSYHEVIQAIVEADPRYDPASYFFIRDALDFTVNTLSKPTQGPERHVSGQELLEGIKTYSLQRFGPMAQTVFSTWGISTTEDFGEIVFNLVESGSLGRTDEDSRQDFAKGYSFDATFTQPFLPPSAHKKSKKTKS